MKKILSKYKVNKLTFSFLVILICVTVLAFTVALSLGYYNVNSAVDKLFNETVSNYQSNLIENMSSIDSKLNLTTYQMLKDSQINKIITSNHNYSTIEIINLSSIVTTYITDYIGYTDLYIVNTRNDDIFTKRLLPLSDNYNYLTEYINKEDFLKKCHNGERNYIAPNNGDYVILTTYDFSGYAIAYIFEKNVLFDSVCNFDNKHYKTAVYYGENLFLTNSRDNINFPSVLEETSKQIFRHSSGSYTVLTDMNSNATSDFYKPFIIQIAVFSVIIIIIGILSLIISVKVLEKTSENYINNLLSHSLQHQYTAIKSTIQKAIRNQYLQQSEEEFIDEYFNKIEYSILNCCQIKLDHINTMLLSYSYKNIAMYMQKIKLIFEDKLSSLGTCIIIDIDFDSIGIILAPNNLLENNEFNNALSAARADIDKLLTLSITVATTKTLSSHTEIFNTFIHLNQLMKYRFFTGYNSTITDNDEIKSTQIYPIAKQQQILTYMLSRKTDKFKFLLTEFFDDAKKINCDDAKKWVLDLSMALLKHYPSTEGAVDMISQLSQAETLDEQFEILKKHFIDVIPDSEENAVSSESFLTRVNDIIESEYPNLDFNLSSLADSLALSSVYAGKKFKSVFEKTFTSYLAEFRVHKAIELMQNSDCTSTEIAKKCGFSSSTYFIKTFKKITNMTPSEYKKTM